MGIKSLPTDLSLQDIQEGKLKPTVLEIHPSPASDSPELPLYLTNLSLWSFPDGFKVHRETGELIYSSECNEKYILRADAVHHHGPVNGDIHCFMMTDENYHRRYCSSLLFHEPFTLKTTADTLENQSNVILIPKSITIVSEAPYLDAQKQLLEYIYDTFVSQQKENHEKTVKIPSKYIQHVHSLLRPGLESLLAYEEFESENSTIEGNMPTLVKESQLRELYVSAAYSLFPKINPSQPARDRVILKLKEHGKTGTVEEELVRFRVYRGLGIDLPTSSFKPLFEALSGKHIIRLLKCILLERQIIFFSSKPGEVLYITEALLSLLWPMKWCCLYVPYLPVSIWETLHAVMPYIVGVEAQYKEFIVRHIDLTDKIVVDLDNDALYIGEDTYDFPKKPRECFTESLEQLYKDIKNTDIEKNQAFWAELALKAKHYASTFILMMVNNYLEFFKSSKITSKDRSATSASEIFDFNAYFNYLGNEHAFFMEEIQHTMMFANFIEETFEVLSGSHVHLAITPTSKPSTVTVATEVSRFQSTFDEISNANTSHISSPTDIANLNKPLHNHQGLLLFIKELKDIFITFQKPGISKKKKRTYLDLSNNQVIDYIDIIHSSLVHTAMKQYNHPDKVDLLPYLAKFYCTFLLFSGLILPASNTTIASDEVNFQSPEEKAHFVPIDNYLFTELNKTFLCFPPHFDTVQPSFPSRPKRALTLNLLPKSDCSVEPPAFSGFREPPEYRVQQYSQSQKDPSPTWSTDVPKKEVVIRPSPSRMHGPRLNLETPKSSKINFFEDPVYEMPKELTKTTSLIERTSTEKNSLEKTSLERNMSMPQTVPKSCDKTVKAEERSSPVFGYYSGESGEKNSEDLGKEKVEGSPYKMAVRGASRTEGKRRIFENDVREGAEKAGTEEKENPRKERKRKLIFELKNVEDGEKVWKNGENVMGNLNILGLSPFKEPKETQMSKCSKENENGKEGYSPDRKYQKNEGMRMFDINNFNNMLMSRAEKNGAEKESKEVVKEEDKEKRVDEEPAGGLDMDDFVKEEELQEHADDYRKFMVPN